MNVGESEKSILKNVFSLPKIIIIKKKSRKFQSITLWLQDTVYKISVYNTMAPPLPHFLKVTCKRTGTAYTGTVKVPNKQKSV